MAPSGALPLDARFGLLGAWSEVVGDPVAIVVLAVAHLGLAFDLTGASDLAALANGVAGPTGGVIVRRLRGIACGADSRIMRGDVSLVVDRAVAIVVDAVARLVGLADALVTRERVALTLECPGTADPRVAALGCGAPVRAARLAELGHVVDDAVAVVVDAVARLLLGLSLALTIERRAAAHIVPGRADADPATPAVAASGAEPGHVVDLAVAVVVDRVAHLAGRALLPDALYAARAAAKRP